MITEDIAPKLIKKAFYMIFTDLGYIALYTLPIFAALLTLSLMQILFGMNPILITPSPLSIEGIVTQLLTLVIFSLIVGICALLSYTAVAIKANSQEKRNPVTTSKALRKSLGYLPTVIGASIIVLLVEASPFLLAALITGIGLIAHDLTLAIIGLLLMLVLFIPAFYIGLRLSVYLPASVIDDLSAVECIRKSWRVTKGHLLLVFIITVFLIIISILFNSISSIFNILYYGMGTILSICLSFLIPGPLSAVVWTLLYRELTGKSREESTKTYEPIEV